MADFTVSSSVRRLGNDRFLAMACAVACAPESGTAPDERSRICSTLTAAREAELDLASELSYEINGRGDRVVDIRIDA